MHLICQGHHRNLPLKNCITATKIETHFHNTALQCTQEHYTCAHKDTPPIQKGCTHTSISSLNTHTDVSKRLHGQGLLSHEYVLLYLKMVWRLDFGQSLNYNNKTNGHPPVIPYTSPSSVLNWKYKNMATKITTTTISPRGETYRLLKDLLESVSCEKTKKKTHYQGLFIFVAGLFFLEEMYLLCSIII